MKTMQELVLVAAGLFATEAYAASPCGESDFLSNPRISRQQWVECVKANAADAETVYRVCAFLALHLTLKRISRTDPDFLTLVDICNHAQTDRFGNNSCLAARDVFKGTDISVPELTCGNRTSTK